MVYTGYIHWNGKGGIRLNRDREPRRAAPSPARRAAPVGRFHPDPRVGLSGEQVRQRVQQGLHNGISGIKTKTEGQIIRENVFTFFNILNFALAAAVILVGSFRSAVFLGVIFANIFIGSFQSIRAKRTLDKLSIVSAPKAAVLREGVKKEIPVEQVVLDDILVLSAGNQICSDAIVSAGECEVNESLITGESDPILKRPGDSLLSGSFVVSGSVHAQVEHVAPGTTPPRSPGTPSTFKKRNSEIMDSIDRIVKWVGFGILPIGALLFWKQFFVLGDTLQNSVVSTTAAMVGMIPEGLVLLVSVCFAVSVVKLSARKTLVRDLYCVETLARVDTLCLDKTGTITEGTMQVDELVPFEGVTQQEMDAALNGLVSNLPDGNPTFQAIQERYPSPALAGRHAGALLLRPEVERRVLPGRGAFVMGAGEFILGEGFSAIREQVEGYSQQGQRVLLLAQSQEDFDGQALPGQLRLLGLVLISDKIRREAPRTLRYFADQGVDLKVISGDNAVTVANIARKAGLENADKYVDATTLRTEEDIRRAVSEYSVFGRVTPPAEAQLRQGAEGPGPHGGHDRRRRQRRAGLEGGGLLHRHGLRQRRGPHRLQPGAAGLQLRLHARGGAGGPPVHQQPAALQRPVPLQDHFLGADRRAVHLHQLQLPLPAGAADADLHPDHRHALLHPGLRAQQRAAAGQVHLKRHPPEHPGGPDHDRQHRAAVCPSASPLGLSNPDMSTLAVILTCLTGFIMLFKVSTPFNGLRGALFGVLLSGFVASLLFLRDFFALTNLTMPMLIALAPMLLFAIVIDAGPAPLCGPHHRQLPKPPAAAGQAQRAAAQDVKLAPKPHIKKFPTGSQNPVGNFLFTWMLQHAILLHIAFHGFQQFGVGAVLF